MVEAAQWYAANNFPIFPLKPRGKEPLTKHGFKDATTDKACISKWWEKWPEANIGLPTGTKSGLLVVDCDPRNGGPADRAELIEQCGPIPETAEVLTGGGGRHVYFRYHGGPIPKTLAHGIDLKGDGGYVVAPPSMHASGKRYEVDGTRGAKALLNPAEPPEWLRERLNAAAPRESIANASGVAMWRPGERNSNLTSLAGTMRRQGCTSEAIEAVLLEENKRRCNPPLEETEVRRIAKSVARYEPGQPESGPQDEDDSNALPVQWPIPLREEAYQGLVGTWVRMVEPHTEADPAALIIQMLVAFGNMIGRNPHYLVEADRHNTNLFAVIVGQTAKGRKGTSLGHVKEMLKAIDEQWCETRMMGGLSSGEGLIWSVRDEIRESVPIRDRSQLIRHEEQVTDSGVQDKRLLVTESEFASVLQRAERETNTLSAIIRQSWDSGSLRVLTKKQSASTTDAHISIIAHITGDELRRLLNSTEAANGFANRFLWVCAKRSRCLPDGGTLDQVDFSELTQQLRDAARFARDVGRMERDVRAKAIWYKVYPVLSEGKPGLLGSVTSRAEPQVLRLACIYALLDSSATVREEHLIAALEIWRYCEDSARFIFGDALGDATGDEIIRVLRQRPQQGMTRNDIRDHFKRNKSSAEIGRALGVLLEYGLTRVERNKEDESQKRPTERWFGANGVRG